MAHYRGGYLHGEAFLNLIEDEDVLTKLKRVDGLNSGLDADLVRNTTPTSTGLAYLSGTTGFVEDGHVATDSKLNNRINDAVNVLDYVSPTIRSAIIARTNTDDVTAAFVSARTDALARGLPVHVPAGVYVVSSLAGIVNTPLIGDGFTTKTREPYGSASWSDESNFKGTVIRVTATTGNAIEIGDGSVSPWYYGGEVRGILFIGPGAGSSVGLYLNNVISGSFYNVGVANFAVGMDWNFVEDCAFYSPKFWGCDTAFTSHVDGNNQNSFYQAEFNHNNRQIVASYGDMNVFYGGLIQNTHVDGIVLETSVGSILRYWKFRDIWFEDDALMTGDIVRMGGNNLVGIEFRGGRFTEVGGFNLTGGTDNRSHVFEDLVFIGHKTITIPTNMANCTVSRLTNATIVDNSAGSKIDEDGTFTATLTGVTATVTGSIDYTLSNRVVSLDIDTITGTSNTTAATLTGLPQNITPQENTGWFVVRVYENGNIQFGIARVTTAGAIELLSTAAGNSFTASGTKGIGSCCVTYNLDVP